MGRRRKGRSVHGILLLDKPKGMTSNAALQKAKRLFQAQKAGHTGSLDPLATGMLPLCFGEATKVCNFLLDSDKCYTVRLRFGEQTDTADADGEVVQTAGTKAVTERKIRKACKQFLGEIEQVPPMYSALKKDGQRLHELARQGIEVEREARTVYIDEFELLSLEERDGLPEATLRVICSKGTYIRSLGEDLAAELDSLAHVVMLRRDWVDPYEEAELITLEALEKLAEDGYDALHTALTTAESALSDLPVVELRADLAGFIKQGNPVFHSDVPEDEPVRLRELLEDGQKRFIGMGELNADGMLAPKRLIRCD
ncbi:MAG: tRNA pseudouridine(55) synthase TruB [Gammaproteobacteria bacterium]|nr:tRNA pseudouridine(55) synthase TruB [Gammaproteobacteria bacterium]